MSRTMRATLAALGVAALALTPAPAPAQSGAPSSETPYDFFSRGPYAAGVPRPEEILGYPIATRHSYHHQMEAYFAALTRSPAAGRLKLVSIGASYEGRKLWLLFVSSEENIARLEAIRQQVARLTDPRATPEAEARRIAAATPAIVWLNYANDGNESAAFEAGMQTAYQLAAGEDPATRSIRERVVTIINPSHNPESHTRFVTWYNAITTGRGGVADPNAAEHAGDWLMDSNDNHYHIDLNRDAFALTQAESQAIVRQLHHWNPQVFIDHHGNPPVFYFPPVALPVNQNFGPLHARWEEIYGRAIAAEFDRHGWSYMNREVFDLFYPGYFDSFPSLTGASGMTFETDGGGSQGLRLERADGTISTLHAGVAKHFAGSMAVLEATAARKEERLADFYLFRKTAMEEAAREPLKQIVLVEGSDAGRLAGLLGLLLEHRVEIYRAASAFSSTRARRYGQTEAQSKSFPAGSYVIPLAQPQKRLIKTLLEPEAQLSEEFLSEVMARRKRNAALGRGARREPYGFYDVTAWSLPLTFGVEAWWTEDASLGGGLARIASAPRPAGGVSGGPAGYGYLFRYDSNAAAVLLARLLQEDFRALVARSEVRVGAGGAAEVFERGSILLRVERNPAALHARIAALAAELGVRVRGVDAAWTDTGISLGSGRMEDLKRPRVAVATYQPTNGRSYGSLWFLFEQILGYEFTPIRTDRLRSADLSRYDVLIFPDGSDAAYQDILGPAGVASIRRWIEQGGVLIGIKGGAALATRRNVEWTTARLLGREEPAREGQPAAGGQRPAEPEPEVERTPGAILRAEMNLAHFLTFGYGAEEMVMHNSDYIFVPGRNPTQAVRYAAENPRVSGFVWEDTQARLAGSPYLLAETLGRGQVILFADDPNFRLVWPRLTRLFLNAVFFAPSLR